MHAAKVLTGEETLPEAAGGTLRDVLSDSKGTSSTKSGAMAVPKNARASGNASAKKKATATKKTSPKKKSIRKKGRGK
jgi:type IV secretory pathway TrbL component